MKSLSQTAALCLPMPAAMKDRRIPFANTPAQSARRAVALLAALCATAGSQAALQSYSNEASFLAAVGPVSTENFNSFTSDVTSAGVALFSFTDFTVLGRWVIDAPATQLVTDGSTNLFMDVSFGGFTQLQFSQPLLAWGAWFINRAPDTIRVDANGLAGPGSFQSVGLLSPTGSALQFIGFTADQPFNRITFEGSLSSPRTFAIDNLSYAASLAPAVPEPASWALMAAGLTGLAGWARRRVAAGQPA